MSTTTPTPSRGSKAYLTDRVSTLTARNRQLQARIKQLEGEARQAKVNETLLRSDLTRVAKSLRREARKRVWCSEYESFVRALNPYLSEPWLLDRRPESDSCTCEYCTRVRAGQRAVRR